MIACPRCTTANPDNARFCMNCGNPFIQKCPTCGQESPASAKFCWNCGHAFAQAQPAAPPMTASASPEPVGDRLERYMPRELRAKLDAARSNRSMEGERRIVTILFCDVKGSTAMAEQLDPEEWAQIMNTIFEYMIAPVYNYEGTIARLMGDSILAFFGAPIAHEDDPQRAILAGDEVSGVTIMRMDEGLDTGPMLLKRELSLDGKDAGQVTEELSVLGAKTLIDWLASPTPAEAQPKDGVTYAAKVDKAEARIDWSRSAEEIARQVRAFAPAPGAWFEVNGERVKLLEAEALSRPPRESGGPAVSTGEQRDSRLHGNGGEVVDDCLTISCATGYIRPLKVQRAGRGPMTAAEFLRGFPIPQGTILS